MSLWCEAPERPNISYVSLLAQHHGKLISESFISYWFKKRFPHKGSFKKPNMVPLDKFRRGNIARYFEFKAKLALLSDHSVINCLDEKHIVNKDALPTKVRACPMTGYTPYLQVSGDFREAFNIFAVISSNPRKSKAMEHWITKDNGNANSFVMFIKMLIVSKWLLHDEILIMDNARIHTAEEAVIVMDLLWDTVIDGRPLRNLIIYLPTRSPELNPIEYVFHILSTRLRSFSYRHIGRQADMAGVIERASFIMDSMDYAMLLRCFIHCGY